LTNLPARQLIYAILPPPPLHDAAQRARRHQYRLRLMKELGQDERRHVGTYQTDPKLRPEYEVQGLASIYRTRRHDIRLKDGFESWGVVTK